MANFLEIVPTTDGSYADPPLILPPADWLKVKDLHFDSPDRVLEIPSQYPDQVPSNCLTCGAWFHYPKDQLGGDVPGGVWILCIAGPCAGAHDYQWQFVDATQIPGWIAGCAFSVATTDAESVIQDMVDAVNAGQALITVAFVAASAWKHHATTLFQAQGEADGYALGCAPGPTGNPCVNGYYYDPQLEACIPLTDITGHIPPLPIGQGQPGGGKNPNQPPPPDLSDLDEIGQCCVQTNANLVLIQQELQALQKSILGQGGNNPSLDPVTCTQLTGLFVVLDKTVASIAAAIAEAATAGLTPAALRPIVDALTQLTAAVTKIANSPAGESVDLSHLNAWADLKVAQDTLTTGNALLIKAQIVADYATLTAGLQ